MTLCLAPPDQLSDTCKITLPVSEGHCNSLFQYTGVVAHRGSQRSTPSEHALLLRDFANTVNISEGTDMLASPAGLATWLRDHALIPSGPVRTGADSAHPRGQAEQADLETAIALRTSLRAAIRAHHGSAGIDTASRDRAEHDAASRDTKRFQSGLETVAAGLPLRVAESRGVPALFPIDGGIRGGLASLAAAIVASAADRSWERLKICAEDTCQWAFLDSSKNRSKHWCSMQECGNRAKTRAYRARRAAGHTTP